MDKFEKRVSTTRIFDGKIINVRTDNVVLPNGEEGYREIVEHPGGVAVALENSDGTFYLVNQFRYGQQKLMLEFPAGKKERGEDPLVTAKREIIEETGYSAKDFVYLGQMVPTGAYLEEVIDMYYAKADKFIGQHFDEDEFITLEKYTLNEIIEMCMNQNICDGKTIAMAFMIREMKDKLVTNKVR